MARLGARVGVKTHFVFGESHRAGLIALATPFQEATAEERKFLYLNSISPSEGKIGSNGIGGPGSISSSRFKCEDAKSYVLRESGKYKLHLAALSASLRGRESGEPT